ncbi:hypothetical protein O181_002608 [Austropuccinia psidii MF-1]|uniref:Uncharacterized protein n=1 Tax=Austropuccinia psidii MF-1 TaxID=1389203 RepID=A0A9Q3GCS9_9BASI|nr:hypothetical protein [Austropuccinia psidii MF-1]
MKKPNRHMLRLQIAIQEYKVDIHQNDDRPSMWKLANTTDITAHLPLEEDPHIPIEGINITDIGTALFEEFRE